jgi:AAA domain
VIQAETQAEDVRVEDMPREEPHNVRPIRILTVNEALHRPSPRWLIEDLLPERGLGMVYGPPKNAKSFVALDMACSIAASTRWGDRSVLPGDVVYVLGEGAGYVGLRLRAWMDGAGVQAEQLGRLSIVPSGVDLGNPEQVEGLLQALAERGTRPVLVVFDTLARCMSGDENQAQEMGRVVSGCDLVRERLEAAVLLVHHSRRAGDSERGSSALPGAVDTKLRLERKGSELTLHCEMQKDAAECDPIGLELEVVDLGVGEDGKPVSSCRIRSRTIGRSSDPLFDRFVQRVAKRLWDDSGRRWKKKREIAEALDEEPWKVLDALNKLRDCGYAEREGHGPATVYAFTPRGREQYQRIVLNRSKGSSNDPGSPGESCDARPPPKGAERFTRAETARSRATRDGTGEGDPPPDFEQEGGT